MVLQYANGGNLRDFLSKNHENLRWNTRIKMAKQIASGLKCIHECNIVHRDLVSEFDSFPSKNYLNLTFNIIPL